MLQQTTLKMLFLSLPTIEHNCHIFSFVFSRDIAKKWFWRLSNMTLLSILLKSKFLKMKLCFSKDSPRNWMNCNSFENCPSYPKIVPSSRDSTLQSWSQIKTIKNLIHTVPCMPTATPNNYMIFHVLLNFWRKKKRWHTKFFVTASPVYLTCNLKSITLLNITACSCPSIQQKDKVFYRHTQKNVHQITL